MNSSTYGILGTAIGHTSGKVVSRSLAPLFRKRLTGTGLAGVRGKKAEAIGISLAGGTGRFGIILRGLSKTGLGTSSFVFRVASGGNGVSCSGDLLRSRVLACRT